MERAVGTLSTWTDRLRGASCPPVLPTELLSALGRHAKAYLILNVAAEAAFAPGSRIEHARIHVDLASDDFAATVPRVRRAAGGGRNL